MAKIDITRTELVWPGKYDDEGRLVESPRVNLPFQVIETVNESRATREAKKTLTLFDYYEGDEGSTFEDGWKNKLVWGDNLLVMSSLLEKFAGKIDLIYIDPPFATGADFSVEAEVGDDVVVKERSALEEKAYRDTWGAKPESYLAMLYPRLMVARELLAEHGAFFVHCDWRMNSMIRVLLDEVMGADCFRNEIIWRRAPNLGRQAAASQLGRVIDTILVYSKSPGSPFRGKMPVRSAAVPLDRKGNPKNAKWDPDRGLYFTTAPRGDYTDDSVARLEEEGRIYRSGTGTVYIKYFLRLGEDGVWYKDQPADTLWDDYDVRPLRHCGRDELDIGYDTQKPEGLLTRIVEWASQPGDLVVDFFCGSGTTVAVAEKTGRRWIGCDLGRYAIQVTRKRLLSIEDCNPFELLNLGKYERQFWQSVTFGAHSEQALYEYLAFVLKLYGSEPLTGLESIHGKKGPALVHIGAVDAPVTIDEVYSAVDECVGLKATELHILGWEWEMGLNDLVVGEAAKRGVKLVLRQIPREAMEAEAVRKGDVRFFELAYVQMKAKPDGSKTYRIELEDFVLPNTELIPEDVREKITKWSDYIDYWSIDWDFQNDTFMQGWVAYRTRKERKLPLVSDSHTYEEPGTYRVLVKVIDIFGNDTTQALDIEVS